MAHDHPQIPWTQDQWARIEDVIQQEAKSARVAASFLPLFGPLPPDADFVRADTITDGTPAVAGGAAGTFATIDDRATLQLATLQVEVELRGPQIADPQLSSALDLFRRAANVLARLEDFVVFRGLAAGPALHLPPPPIVTPPPPGNWALRGGQPTEGLWSEPNALTQTVAAPAAGDELVTAVSGAILQLEQRGQFGPFAVVLGHTFFNAVQTPAVGLVLPQDRIIPFLGGGPLLRSSALELETGVVVALGGAPLDLVVARDTSLEFLTVTPDPAYIFRVVEKIVLRIKQPTAICKLQLAGAAAPVPVIPRPPGEDGGGDEGGDAGGDEGGDEGGDAGGDAGGDEGGRKKS
jgi:uncharacterized linocin/CFP29 family protein